jgi:hypothetical protein
MYQIFSEKPTPMTHEVFMPFPDLACGHGLLSKAMNPSVLPFIRRQSRLGAFRKKAEKKSRKNVAG